MKYTQRKASENTDIFKIGLKIQISPTAPSESKFQTFPQNKSQNIITQQLLKSEYQLSNILYHHFIYVNEMRIKN